MFLGIFSSIIPYVIAAGFYLVWVLFSFVQPYFQKSSEEISQPQDKIISIENEFEFASEKIADFEDYLASENNSEDIIPWSGWLQSFQDPLLSFIPPDPAVHFKSKPAVTGLFCRPPPAC
jgi:hypothetical protein